MTNKRNTFLHLKSNSGVLNTKTRYYRFDLMNPIVCKKNELINVRVAEMEIPISYYNVTSDNNVFEMSFILADGTSGIFSKTFTEGNYTTNDLIESLNSIGNKTAGFNTVSLVVSISKKTQKFSFVVTSSASNIDSISFDQNVTCEKILGLNKQNFSPTSTASFTIVADNVCDLNRTNNIYLETDLLLESRNTFGEKLGILAKVQMNKNFFDIVHFQNNTNEDITLDKKDTYLDHINLRLATEENNQTLNFNGSEWTASLLFSFIEQDKMLLGDEIERGDTNPIINNIGYESEKEYSDNEI